MPYLFPIRLVSGPENRKPVANAAARSKRTRIQRNVYPDNPLSQGKVLIVIFIEQPEGEGAEGAERRQGKFQATLPSLTLAVAVGRQVTSMIY